MWRSLITYCVALACLVTGLGIAAYKHLELSFPLVPDSSINSWYIEMHSTFQTTPGHRNLPDASVVIHAPINADNFAVVDSQTIARNFGKQTAVENEQVLTTFTKRDPQESEAIHLRFMLYELDVNDAGRNAGNEDNQQYLATEYGRNNRIYNPDEATAALYDSIDLIVDEALRKSASSKSYLVELNKALKADADTARYLKQNMGIKDDAELLMLLLRVAEYPARIANGLLLEDKMVGSARFKRWIEVKHKDSWLRFDAETGDYIPGSTRLYRWWVGTGGLVAASSFGNYVTTVSVKPNIDSSLTRALWQAKEKQPLAYRLAPQNLPLDQQLVLQVLLLLPIGGLIVTVMRQMIGVKTFGTFMPVLVALAFRETGLIVGLGFFAGIVFAGLLIRSYLARLRLLFVPRLSAVMCVVVVLIMFAMIFANQNNTQFGVSIALFPVVIMTMFIERMSTMWDESGAKPTFVAFAGSMAVAMLVYGVSINDYVRHAMMTFPELLLVVFAIALVLGRYTGFRLTEYLRFRQLQRSLRDQQERAAKTASGQQGSN